MESMTPLHWPPPTLESRSAPLAPSSQAAQAIILPNRLDGVGEAIVIAQRARRIAVQSIVAGIGLSGLAMLAATLGWLAPVPAAILQEVIDLTVIVNALRVLKPACRTRHVLPAKIGAALHHDHVVLRRSLDRLRAITSALDDDAFESTPALIAEANDIVQEQIVRHECNDEASVYPKLARLLADRHGLAAMSRAHREILHLARSLARIVEDLPLERIDHYLVRDAQRVIEAIVDVHTAQEDDIYEAVAAN
jgi:Hemerythrin HHE cation binding domain